MGRAEFWKEFNSLSKTERLSNNTEIRWKLKKCYRFLCMKRFPFGSILLTITALQSWSVEKRWKSGSTLERRFNPIQLRPGLFRIAALRYRSGWKRETLVVAGSIDEKRDRKGKRKKYCNREGTSALGAHKDTRRSDFPVGQLAFSPFPPLYWLSLIEMRRNKTEESIRFRSTPAAQRPGLLLQAFGSNNSSALTCCCSRCSKGIAAFPFWGFFTGRMANGLESRGGGGD